MKNKIKNLFGLILSIIISFVIVYMFVFFGGYKLFESGNVILQELGISSIIGFDLFFVVKLFKANSDKIAELEKRIQELENKL